MINQRFHPLKETQGVRQAGVLIEGGFVFPAGMDVEQQRITR